MLFNILAQLALVAVGVSAAVNPCEPGGSTSQPPTSTSKPPTGPTGPVSGTTTLKNHGKCMDLDGANYNDGTKVQM